ncbi:hypothetical protein [Haloarcula nitratireducens]|uniref:DUF8055 domain-containing protein n=1 Tax=Haloarcula nitratireducens TaxID=2487749 RepID=A0AAW4P9N4_9EURY|nr:hypothetical protein [Halomicroarcula nitratireducens]MBX0294468.1 hypothetical protein [Halomicroarcula nitratireducens]
MSQHPQYDERIRALERAAEEAAESLDPDPPDEARATEIVREGVGPTVALYCEARTGGTWARFDDETFDRLETTLNHWLDCYAACYGVSLDGVYSVRTAAELLVDTHDAAAVAATLTGVPE